MKLTPFRTEYHPGENISCSADGFPPPTYHWKDLASESIIHGPVLILGEGFTVSQHYVYTCTAQNTINEKVETEHAKVTFSIRITGKLCFFFKSHCQSYLRLN